MSKYQWKYHLNLEILETKNKKQRETCTFINGVQFGFLFYVCGVASYWMINLFTSTYKREKRREIQKGFSITFPSTPQYRELDSFQFSLQHFTRGASWKYYYLHGVGGVVSNREGSWLKRGEQEEGSWQWGELTWIRYADVVKFGDKYKKTCRGPFLCLYSGEKWCSSK